MTTLELVTYLRTNILDDIGGQNVDWTDFSEDTFDSIQLRWKNEELVANINEAITQVYRRTNPIKSVELLDVSSGQSEYSIPSYIQNILAIKTSLGRGLIERELIDLWWDEKLDTNTGDLEIWIPDFTTSTIKFAPVPVADDTVTMMVYRYPKVPLTWEDTDASPELLSQYHLPMLWYAAFLCYSKDEANTLDKNRAATMMSYFDKEFPFTSIYSNVRKSRTSNRAIKYGGILQDKSLKNSLRNSRFR